MASSDLFLTRRGDTVVFATEAIWQCSCPYQQKYCWKESLFFYFCCYFCSGCKFLSSIFNPSRKPRFKVHASGAEQKPTAPRIDIPRSCANCPTFLSPPIDSFLRPLKNLSTNAQHNVSLPTRYLSSQKKER